jgi:hypothetical protein
MNAELARALIAEAKSIEVYDGPMPDDDAKALKEAERIYDQAAAAYKAGARGDKVTTIMQLALNGESPPKEAPDERTAVSQPNDSDPVTVSQDDTMPAGEGVASEPRLSSRADEAKGSVTLLADAPSPSHPIDKAYEEKELALARIRKMRFPVPDEPEGEQPCLPRDITKLAEAEVRNQRGQYSAWLSYANWQTALCEADKEAAERVAEHHANRALERADKLDEITGKAKLVAVLEAEAGRDPQVVVWRNAALEHRNTLRFLKALKETYRGKCELLESEMMTRMSERKHTV